VTRRGSPDSSRGPGPAPVDLDRAARHAGGDPALLAEVLSLVAAESRSILAAVQEAARRGDLEAVERAAHALKGSASNVAADALVAAASGLERAAREGRTEGMDALIARLAHEAERLDVFMARVEP
jgi:HPt (histidine-containing phosphotransfer) domain-containing protein